AAGGGQIAEQVLLRLSGGREPGAPLTAPAPPRLVSISENRIELAHDFLTNGWPTLRAWLDEERAKLQIRDDLDGAAQAWYGAGSPLGGLPSGDQLGYFNRVRSATSADGAVPQVALPSTAGSNFLRAANELEERRRILRFMAEEFAADFQFSREL